MKYLDCECTYFPSMRDDDPIMSAYRYARRLGVREGFIPLLVKVFLHLAQDFLPVHVVVLGIFLALADQLL